MMQATLGKVATKNPKPQNYGAAVLAIAVKGKTLLLGAAKLKYLYTIISAVISVIAYAGRFGWAGAIGFVALLFVHEMGHVLMLRSQGVPATAPLFIPFVGALIGMKTYPKGVVDEAYSAMAGPVLGSAGALVCLLAYFATGAQIWAWLAYVGFVLNLFNLLPMSPLDGGRVIGAIWRGFWIIGVVAAVGVAHWLESPLLLLFAVFGLDEINRRYMKVHGAAYAVVGIAAILSCALNRDLIWGFLIAFFAYTHAASARKANLAKAQVERRPIFKITGASFCPLVTGYPQSAQCARGRKLRRIFAPIRSKSESAYFSVPPKQRMIIGTAYVTLATALTGAMIWMHHANILPTSHHR